MASIRQWWNVCLVGLGGSLLAGCASLPDYAMPARSFSADISDTSARPQVRSQVGDGPLGKPSVLTPSGQVAPPQVDRPPNFMPEKTPAILVPPPPGVVQASASKRGTVRVRVRAWVNGRPIFDDEVAQGAGASVAEMRRIYLLPEAQRNQEMAKLVNGVLETIIDQELMHQEAVKMLQKNNPKMLDKMKDYVDLEFDKTLKNMRDKKVPEDQIREVEPTARRMMERNLISTEYARSRIMDTVKQRVNIDTIRDYYETHMSEFRTVDKVVWQDIFIPTSANLPTIEHVKRFAQDALSKCKQPGDFDRLMVYNEGDSKLRGGEGLGQRLSYKDKDGKMVAGEIRPAELEEHLARLRDGEVGPIVAFSTGVHLIRATKREYAGQMPLDDKVQKTIAKELEKQIADREYRRITRELRLRARIEYEREAP